MAENSGICWTRTVSSAGAINYVNFIVDALGQPGIHYWTVLTSNLTVGQGAHLRCTATNAECVIKIVSSTMISFGYSPGAITDPFGTPTAGAFTGMRQITGNTDVSMSNIGRKLRFAEYEDAFTFMVGEANEMAVRYITHLGRILEYTDTVSDEALKIGGHGFTTGRARKEGGTGYWLTGNNAAVYVAHTQCFQTSSTTFANGSVVVLWNAANTLLSDILTNVRLVPQPMCLITAGSGVGQFIGYTKYVRLYKNNAYYNQVLESTTPGSDQAWLGFIGDAGTTPNTNAFVLWSKSAEEI